MKAINALLDTEKREFEISYGKWLMEVFTEPSEAELDEMEKSFFKPFTTGNRIITLKPLNNPYYLPIIGA